MYRGNARQDGFPFLEHFIAAVFLVDAAAPSPSHPSSGALVAIVGKYYVRSIGPGRYVPLFQRKLLAIIAVECVSVWFGPLQ